MRSSLIRAFRDLFACYPTLAPDLPIPFMKLSKDTPNHTIAPIPRRAMATLPNILAGAFDASELPAQELLSEIGRVIDIGDEPTLFGLPAEQ
jgi:hypothetical protein